MLGLIFDISRNLTGVLRTNAEPAVTGLPFKMARNYGIKSMSLIHLDEPPFSAFMKSESDTLFDDLINRWTWSGIPLIESETAPCSLTIPAIYEYILAAMSPVSPAINGSRFFVENMR